jgi:hypothetical protein
MCLVRWITIIAVALVATGPARAHVQPSPNENNRHLKLTPLGDRVRLAYTIYFGETPGAALRREIDKDRSGTVDDDEAAAFGRRMAAEVRPAVSATLDGRPAVLAWTDVDVGMGTPEVRAGSFAIDLVGAICLPSRGAHELVVRDEYALPIPGETELQVETGLGVTVERVTLGGALVGGDDVRIRGVGGPLAIGWAIKLTVGDAAPAGGGACGATAARSPATASARWWIAVLVGAVAAAGVIAFAIVRRSARRRPRT